MPTVTRPRHLELVRRQTDYWLTVYRRTWQGSVVVSFLSPVLYLVAMGGVLGRFIDANRPQLGPADSYLQFVGPGLLAVQMLQVAIGEVLWPVMGRLAWNRTYHAMIATPLRVVDIVIAQLGYIVVRVAVSALAFMAALGLAGVFRSVAGVLLVFAAQLLIGLACAAAFYTVGAGARSDAVFALVYRLVFMPLFLLSGAFFPVTTLPAVLQAAAWVTPLWHGVELTRMLALDAVDLPRLALHVGYLAVLSVIGVVLSVRILRQRLIQ